MYLTVQMLDDLRPPLARKSCVSLDLLQNIVLDIGNVKVITDVPQQLLS
jgi:hypothetical protein